MSQDQPSPKDGLFFLTILMTMKNKHEVDWNLVAQKTGYSNAKVAATRFGQMKNKFAAKARPSSADSPSPSTSNSVPSSPPKKRGGSGTNASPSKIIKRSLPKGTVINGKGLGCRSKDGKEISDGMGKFEDHDDVNFEVYENVYA